MTSQLLDALLNTLLALKASDFEETANCITQPYKNYADLDTSTVTPYDLPLVLVPPEVIEMDSLPEESGDETQVKKEDWPEFFVKLFPDDVCHSVYLPLHRVTL